MKYLITILLLFFYSFCCGQINEDSVYRFPDRLAYFSGNTSYSSFIKENIVYPQNALDSNIGGRVWVSFIVEKDGSLTNVSILKSVHPLVDSEAIRVIHLMPVWMPAKNGETIVRSLYNLPIDFIIAAEKPLVKNETPKYFGDFSYDMFNINYDKIPDWRIKEPQKVSVYFQIDEQGKIQAPKVVTPICASIDSEALNVVRRMDKWTPAIKDGRPQASSCTIELIFYLGAKKEWFDWMRYTESKYDSTDFSAYPVDGYLGLSNFLEKETKKSSLNGTVVFQFTVSETGGISDIIIIKPVSKKVDARAFEIIKKMPGWVPAERKGVKISSCVKLNVSFKENEKEEDKPYYNYHRMLNTPYRGFYVR